MRRTETMKQRAARFWSEVPPTVTAPPPVPPRPEPAPAPVLIVPAIEDPVTQRTVTPTLAVYERIAAVLADQQEKPYFWFVETVMAGGLGYFAAIAWIGAHVPPEVFREVPMHHQRWSAPKGEAA